MTTSFVCKTCGETHEGLPTDRAWTLPDVVWAIPEEERSNRAKFNADLCQFGERFFIRGILKVPFNEQAGYYGWGVWVEVSEADFNRYLDLYDKDGSGEPMVPGSIANEIPTYPSTLGLPVMVQFQSSTSRPSLHFLPLDNHALAADQFAGMGNQRYHAILVETGAVSEP